MSGVHDGTSPWEKPWLETKSRKQVMEMLGFDENEILALPSGVEEYEFWRDRNRRDSGIPDRMLDAGYIQQAMNVDARSKSSGMAAQLSERTVWTIPYQLAGESRWRFVWSTRVDWAMTRAIERGAMHSTAKSGIIKWVDAVPEVVSGELAPSAQAVIDGQIERIYNALGRTVGHGLKSAVRTKETQMKMWNRSGSNHMTMDPSGKRHG